MKSSVFRNFSTLRRTQLTILLLNDNINRLVLINYLNMIKEEEFMEGVIRSMLSVLMAIVLILNVDVVQAFAVGENQLSSKETMQSSNDFSTESSDITEHMHMGGRATCQQRAVCTECRQEYGEFGDHIYENDKCIVCGFEKTEPISVTEYNLVTSESDTTDMDTYSSISENSELSSDTTENNVSGEITDLEHQHTWQSEWSKDEESHWHACRDCDEKKDLAVHILGEEKTSQVCEVCGYVIQSAEELKNIEELTYDLVPEYTYSGKEIEPPIGISDGSSELKFGTDYTVSYENNINIGQGIIIITGIGPYKGTKTLKFNILAKNINESDIKVFDLATQIYTGKELTPFVEISYGDKILELGTDYKLTYKNNKNVGRASVTIEGIGNYKSKKTKTFAIIPQKVTNLKAAVSGSNSIKLSWSKLSNVTGYRVYRSTDGKNFSYIKTLKGNNVLTYADKNLTLEKKYYYQVRGYVDDTILNKRFYGELSEVASVAILRVSQKVTSIEATVSGYNSIKLCWNKLSNVTGYRIYRSIDGKDFAYLKTLKGTKVITYTDKDLTTGKTYYYKVRAYLDDTKSNKRYYGAMSASVKEKPILDKVTIKSVTNSSAKKATLSWNKVTGASGYEIYQASSKTGTYTKVKTITSGSTLTYAKTNLDINKTYYYKIRAYRTVDGGKTYGAYSAIKNVTIKDWVKETVNSHLEKMTLEEKVAQLFVITPESLTGVGKVVRAGDTTKKAIQNYPVGGLIYFSQNIQSKEQFIQMIQQTQSFMQEKAKMKAFIAIDEEGGTVARISGNPNTGVPAVPSMNQIGASGETNQAYEIGKKIGEYLSEFQINLDFAPVADIANLEGSIMLERSFGTDAQLVGNMIAAQVKGFKEKNMICALKHFPGLGYTTNDTHLGYVKTDRTKDEMQGCEFIPFEKGIEAGADIVMVGHVSVPNLTGDDTPSSLSKVVITDILRKELGFQGLVVTDALSMKGISKYYTSDQAAIKALEAGVDILLMPQDFKTAYNGVLKAVKNGTITEERINQSVYRILKLKVERGLA